jgi:ribonucleotide reductase alpha subunit/intein/homing endonuclease
MDYQMEYSYVVKRDGRKEKVHFDKITARIENLLSKDELNKVDVINIVQKTINSIKPGITTEELDLESAKICANLATKDYIYSLLAGRILVSNLHKKTSNKFSDKMIRINLDSAENGKLILDEKFVSFVSKNSEYLDSIVDYSRDFNYDIFAFKTLERAYLIKNQKTGFIYERPQDMFLRVATFLNMNDLNNLKKTYDLMSLGNYTHASPTLFNGASTRSQLSSCFLIATDDSMDGITKNWSDVSQISKWGGGIGLHISNIRAYGSLIRGTNGPSSGIIPMLKVYNEIARYVNQCFVGTTKIYTDKGLVQINQLNVGDKVFTMDGSLKEILKVYNDKYENNVLDISIGSTITVTPEHPFYVVKNQIGNIEEIKYRFERGVVHEWVEAKNLTEDDLITIPIPNYEKDYILYNDTDCYMYGIMLNNGRLVDNIFSVTSEKSLEFVKNYLKLNLIDFVEKDNCISWSLSSKFKFNRNQLYDNNNNKKFDNIMLNLPLIKAKWIVKALLENSIIDENYVNIDLSVNIINAVKYLLLRMGVLVSDELKIPITKEIAELLNIEESKYNHRLNQRLKFFRYENNQGLNLYTRITSITERQISDIVYDLEIEKNHNYLTEIGLVHNGGKRKGSIAVYLEPHHSDITEFLELRKNFGAETERARDLFLALWIPDLFMKQVEEDGDWYLMCPDESPNLNEVYGEEYEKLYWRYVGEGKYRKKIKAKDLMKQIMDSQLETGTPYIAYKDHCNRKSNQNNLGTIKSSNLCIEIVEYSDKNETAVCNLASIAINSCLEPFKMKGKFVIYTKKNCKYCNWAKLYMKNKNWDFEEIEDEFGNVAKTRLNKNSNDKITMPQIWYELGKVGGGEEYVGGFEDLLVFTADEYNYDKLYDIAYTATRNLDRVIDLNYYPTIETKRSNMKHRPVGLGIQGLADTLARMRIPFESEKAVEFNKRYMEYIYKASVQASSDMAKERYEDGKKLVEYLNKNNNIPEFYDENYRLDNEEMNNYYHKLRLNLHESKLSKQYGAYSSYESSMVAKGLLQFDLWHEEPILDWGELRRQINKYGIRNSLLTALMPTASTSQILGNNECFEAMTSNMYTRRTLAGDFPLVNKYMMEDFKNIGIWTNDIKDNIIANNGSVSNLNIPELLKDLYKTIWEIKQIWVLKQARARGPYVDQSQSMNIFMETPNYKKLYSSHLWGWKNGLKTGIYYLRSKPSSSAIKFSLDAKYDNCESCSA